jgi:hypothetical protein
LGIRAVELAIDPPHGVEDELGKEGDFGNLIKSIDKN